jgi:hypothetical protein
MLLRWLWGDSKVWRVVRVPGVEEEDRRQLHREFGLLDTKLQMAHLAHSSAGGW